MSWPERMPRRELRAEHPHREAAEELEAQRGVRRATGELECLGQRVVGG